MKYILEQSLYCREKLTKYLEISYMDLYYTEWFIF